MPSPTAIAATPKATTEVNSEACRKDASHDGRTVGVVLGELRVGLAAGDLLGVLADHVRLGVGLPRLRDGLTTEVRRVVGDGDVLVREGVAHDHVGHEPRHREHRSRDDDEEPEQAGRTGAGAGAVAVARHGDPGFCVAPRVARWSTSMIDTDQTSHQGSRGKGRSGGVRHWSTVGWDA